MSDQSSCGALVALKIEGPNPACELAVYDHSFKLVQSGIGRIDTLLPRGLYDVEASIADQRERKSLALHDHTTVHAGTWDLKVGTAAPLSGTLPARTLHEQMAARFSRAPTMTANAPAGDCRLFIFLRTVRRDAAGGLEKPVQRFWTGYKLTAADGKLVSGFADADVASELEGGWCALTVDLAGGGYVLSGPANGDKDICIPLWLQSRFETQMFVPVEDGHPLFDEITLTMAPKNAGFDAARQDQAEFAAAMLAGFRRGYNPVNPDLVRGLLDQKFYDPFVGIVAAHGLLRMERPDEALLRDLMKDLRESLGDHPDVVALELMATPPVPGRVLKYPPNLRLSLDGVLSRSASNSEIIDVNTVLSDVLGGLLTGRYVLWLRDATAKAPVLTVLKDIFWGVVAFAPGVLKLFKGKERPMVRVDLDAFATSLESWLKKQDPETLAVQLGLPGTIIRKTLTSLIGLLPAVHKVARGSLKDIELPASFGNLNNMALAGLNYLIRTAATAKLSPLDRRVSQLIYQYWEASGGGPENAREAGLCQRRLVSLASTACTARDLVPPRADARTDAIVIASILSGLVARLYPFLLVGREYEVLVATGSFAAVTGGTGVFVGPASRTSFGSALEDILKKNLHGSWLSDAKAEDFKPISIREGVAMDFLRLPENYWAAAIDMSASKLVKNPALVAPTQDQVDLRYIELARKIEQDCARLVELVRAAIDPLTPTRAALEELPAALSALRQELQQRISRDVVTTSVAVSMAS